MNLLDVNDIAGTYPQSWYAASTEILPPFPTVEGDLAADVCVIGGGFTGLSAALHLAEAGRDVVLIDAQRVGFGASGRNGGQLGSGQRREQPALEKMLGDEDAMKLWQMGEEAKALVKSLIDRHGIECYLRPGIAWAASSFADVKDMHHYADHMGRKYGYPIEKLDQEGLRALCPSPDYTGGIVDWGAAHLHPLRFATGLARAAKAAGVRLYEGSRAQAIEEGQPCRVVCEKGTITASHVIVAANGYLGNLLPKVASRVMPINNFIVATRPLGEAAQRVLTKDIAVADARFVVNYFRLSHDGRLLFGGGESYGYKFPQDIVAKVRKPMLEIFPHLRNIEIEYAWGGTLAITMKRMPYLARVSPHVLNASGYSGHGVGTATHAGKLMALAIAGETDGFDTMARLPTPVFPGGSSLRTPLLMLAMTWYSLRDRLGI